MTETAKPDPVLASRSSIFEKIPPDLRRRLDQAIVDRDPPGYLALHQKFNLASHGVSPTAFYCYARRLRVLADLAYVQELAAPDAPDAVDLLPTILAHRLLDAAGDEQTSPGTLHRLADACRIASAIRSAARRDAALLEDALRKQKQKDLDRVCDLVHQQARLIRDQAPRPTEP